jgi:hypothetical protein
MAESLVKFDNENEAREVVKDVKSDKTSTNWCILTYKGKSGADAGVISVLSKGDGGLEELKGQLKDDLVGYCLLRQTDQIDESATVKFVFVHWVGDNTPRMQKAKVSIHLPTLKEFLGPFHLDFAATSLDELSQDVITQKVGETSGSGSRVLGSENKRASVQVGKATGGRAVGSDQVSFPNVDELKAQLKSVRSADSSDDWILFTYESSNSNAIVFLGKGNGGAAELASHLKDDIVAYGLVRKIDQIDESKTVKYCYIHWTGETIPRMQKARIGTHRGAMSEFFAPFHVDLSITRQDEISDEIVENLIKSTSGTKSKVLDQVLPSERVVGRKQAENASQPAQTSAQVAPKQLHQRPETGVRKTVVPSVPTERRDDVILSDEAGIRGAIKSVRDDASGTNWALVSYDAPKSKTLVLVGSGSGGLSEFVSHLKDESVGYGLLRFTEKIDESVTVKFCFVNWVGEKINRMQRAVLGTHSGAVKELFAPYHVDINPTRLDEITDDIIVGKIKSAAGTANHVLKG